VDAERKDFILSEKKAQQGQAMQNMKLGTVVKAVVTSVEDYGVFVDLVDLPGVSGLVGEGNSCLVVRTMLKLIGMEGESDVKLCM
jgi:RecJ-like exonuclease